MRRFWLLALLVLLCALPAHGQSTTVSGAITDAGGQAWFAGTIQFRFRPSDSNPSAQYFWNGVPFDKSTTIPANPLSLDSSGSFSGVSVPSNSAIAPAGSTWTTTVCPAATTPNCFSQNLTITGATQNISSQIILPAVVVNLTVPLLGARAYTDAEIVGGVPGIQYFNVTDNTIHVCLQAGFPPCTWQSVPTGGGTIVVSGMKCDGTTDDTATLQAALNTPGAKKVIMPGGTCIINAGGVAVNIPDNIWLTGGGKYGTSLKRANNVNQSTCALILSGANGTVQLSDFTLDYNKANQTSGLRSLCSGQAGTVNGVNIHDMRFINAYQQAVTLLANATFYVTNVSITNSEFENNSTGGTVITDSDCTFGDIWIRAPQHLRIVNNRSEGTDGDFACAQGNAQALTSDVTIADNVVHLARGFGIALGTTNANVAISGNVLDQPTGRTNIIDIGTATEVAISGNTITTGNACSVACGGVGDAPPANHISVTGNTINVDPSQSFNNGISLGGSDLTIAGNTVRNAGASGIVISVDNATQAHGVVIESNIVKNSSRASSGLNPGIALFIAPGGTGSLSEVIIKGNRSYDDQGSPTQGWGIGIAVAGQTTGFGDMLIEGNDVTVNKTAGIVNNATAYTGLMFLNNLGAATGSTFAGLGTPGNGVIEYCQDCTVAATCAGGGTGAIAKRLNGSWVCN